MKNIGVIGVVGGTKKKKTIIEALEELYGKEIILSEEEVTRLNEIQILLSNEKKIALSIDGVMSFLLKTMNYNKMQLEGLEESRESSFKSFLGTITDEEVLVLYDVEQNYDKDNIRNISDLISMSAIENTYGMLLDESGDGSKPVITGDSHKKTVKSLIR